MKLYELKQTGGKVKGCYAGVRFSEDTKQSLWNYMRESKIPNMLDKEKLHTTLLYSRVHCPNYEPLKSVSYTGEPGEFVVWNTQAPDGKTGETSRCLVLKYDCPELEQRHQFLRKEHGATHDYPEFNAHVTLSYDIGDMDEKEFPDIRKYLDTIDIVSEYVEDLQLDWCSKS